MKWQTGSSSITPRLPCVTTVPTLKIFACFALSKHVYPEHHHFQITALYRPSPGHWVAEFHKLVAAGNAKNVLKFRPTLLSSILPKLPDQLKVFITDYMNILFYHDLIRFRFTQYVIDHFSDDFYPAEKWPMITRVIHNLCTRCGMSRESDVVYFTMIPHLVTPDELYAYRRLTRQPCIV